MQTQLYAQYIYITTLDCSFHSSNSSLLAWILLSLPEEEFHLSRPSPLGQPGSFLPATLLHRLQNLQKVQGRNFI